MSRRAHLTIMESGATLPTRPQAASLEVDDWVVVVQQHDEEGAAFALRVSERARRITRDGAGICAVDVVTADRQGLGFWLSLLRNVGVPTNRQARKAARPARAEDLPSGVYEKPGLARSNAQPLASAVGAPARR